MENYAEIKTEISFLKRTFQFYTYTNIKGKITIAQVGINSSWIPCILLELNEFPVGTMCVFILLFVLFAIMSIYIENRFKVFHAGRFKHIVILPILLLPPSF